jgi:hypothetical protein
VPCPAMRALVVAHAGPFVGPSAPAAGAFIEVEKPGHAGPFEPEGSEAMELWLISHG